MTESPSSRRQGTRINIEDLNPADFLRPPPVSTFATTKINVPLAWPKRIPLPAIDALTETETDGGTPFGAFYATAGVRG